MTSREMHYDFKMKLNKIDSQENRNFRIPEIDWYLNEAQELFIKMIAEPRIRSYMGFEKSQRNTDDIRELVVQDHSLTITSNIAILPVNYMFFVRGRVSMTKGDCTDKVATLYIQQHDDLFEESTFTNSSFEWREVNGVFFEDSIKLYTDGTFTNNTLSISYIREPSYIQNAQDYPGGTYNKADGVTALTGSEDCELAEHTHKEIVDIAVLIATGNIQAPDYNIKKDKLTLNHIQ